VGLNTWAGPRAAAPGVDEAQLLDWELVIPARVSVEAAKESLRSAGFTSDAATGRVADPWGTALKL